MKNNINQAVALRIKELLESKNITRYRLAMDGGISHSTLSNIMGDTINNNKLYTVILIAGGFGISVSEFLDSPLFDEDILIL